MSPSFKDAVTICKTIMRNGYDAHIVNTPLQYEVILATEQLEIDLATDIPSDELSKLFPAVEKETNDLAIGRLKADGYLYRFYRMTASETAHPEVILTKVTPTILRKLETLGKVPTTLINGMETLRDKSEHDLSGFDDLSTGNIKLAGLPDKTLKTDYSLAIKALRHAANYNLPIEENTWLSIVRSARRVLEYVPTRTIMKEWRSVEAENIWRFVQLLFDSHVLHGIIPELACLSRVMHTKNDTGVEETIFAHTIAAVKAYPEGELPHDWLGTMAMLFHDIGKLYTGEFFDEKWFFYQHHRVGAEVTRKILHRLHMDSEDIDLICNLVLNHMRFQFMMTDRGIRRFISQSENKRLIEMSRANIVARDDNYTAFNHNTKYLKRAETPEQMLEPLLNGNEIMEMTQLAPGPHVGEIRQALLQAQKQGLVKSHEDAISFTTEYAKRYAT